MNENTNQCQEVSLNFHLACGENAFNKGHECSIKSTWTVLQTQNAQFCIQMYVWTVHLEMGSGDLILLRVTLWWTSFSASREKQLSQLLHAKETGKKARVVIFNLLAVR